jgi:hypothetical protein
MDLLYAAVRDLTALLSGPLLLLWLIIGWSAPFLMLSAVLSLRRIARALERLDAAGSREAPRASGAVLGV